MENKQQKKTPPNPPPTSSLKSQIIKKQMKLCRKCLAISETASWKKCEAGEKIERHLGIWETPASPRTRASCYFHPLFLPALWIGSFCSSIISFGSATDLPLSKAWDRFPSDLASSKAPEGGGDVSPLRVLPGVSTRLLQRRKAESSLCRPGDSPGSTE